MSKRLISPEEFVFKMKYIQMINDGYEEDTHEEMDELICELLISLGYEEGVEIFKDQPKWYA